MRTPADIEVALFTRPAPELVAQIWDDYGIEAAAERWFWLGRWNLQKMAVTGRAILRARAGQPQVRGHNRSTSPEEEAELVALCLRLGSVERACEQTGRNYATLTRVLREAGVTPPRTPRVEVARRSAATKRARAAA